VHKAFWCWLLTIRAVLGVLLGSVAEDRSSCPVHSHTCNIQRNKLFYWQHKLQLGTACLQFSFPVLDPDLLIKS
jgi:hypothetical protein